MVNGRNSARGCPEVSSLLVLRQCVPRVEIQHFQVEHKARRASTSPRNGIATVSINIESAEHSGSAAVPPTFDYSALPDSVQEAVREQTELIQRLLEKTSTEIVQIGLQLKVVRDRLGQERFQPWLRSELLSSQLAATNDLGPAIVSCEGLDRIHPGALLVFAQNGTPAVAEAKVISALPSKRARERPCWDGERRELSFCGDLVKRFRRPAANQERILAAFEEEEWPAAIDDPLPGSFVDAHERLHDSIRRLNRCQKVRRLRFERDGNGRILWRSVEFAAD